jgi:hypothetical protein
MTDPSASRNGLGWATWTKARRPSARRSRAAASGWTSPSRVPGWDCRSWSIWRPCTAAALVSAARRSGDCGRNWCCRGCECRLRQIPAIGRNSRERQYREMHSELAHASRVATMGQLTASITHEVHQPITAAVTYASAARRRGDRHPGPAFPPGKDMVIFARASEVLSLQAANTWV